jgi:hypothetical protein
MIDPVRFSVVVVWRHAHEAVEETLRTLQAQFGSVAGGGELIVVTSLAEPETCAIEDAFPDARWVKLAQPLSESRAWEAGVAGARGEVVAFANAACRYAPGWAAAALGALAHDDEVAAGPVEFDKNSSLHAVAAYLCDYGALADPNGPRRPTAAACNVAFRASALRVKCDGRGLEKTALVSGSDFHLVWVTAMRAEASASETFWSHCVARFLRGRRFASWRSKQWPLHLRLAAFLGCLFLPAILLARLVANPYLRERFAPAIGLALPWLGASLALWSLGEMVGYLAGERAQKTSLQFQ